MASESTGSHTVPGHIRYKGGSVASRFSPPGGVPSRPRSGSGSLLPNTNLGLEEVQAPWGGKKALEQSDRLSAALALSNLSRHPSPQRGQGRGWHLPGRSSPLSPLVTLVTSPTGALTEVLTDATPVALCSYCPTAATRQPTPETVHSVFSGLPSWRSDLWPFSGRCLGASACQGSPGTGARNNQTYPLRPRPGALCRSPVRKGF